MATRFKTNDLKEMIRSLVREELEGVLKSTINELLSERYLKQLAEASSRPRGVSQNLPIQGDEDEEEVSPKVLSNSILGIGQKNPIFKKEPSSKRVVQHNENNQRDEMLSLFFEGTRPLSETEREIDEGVPLPLEQKPIEDMANKWKYLVEAADQAAESRRPMKVTRSVEAEEARLKMVREQLERKVG